MDPGGELVERVIGRVEFHDEDVSGIFAEADCAEDAGWVGWGVDEYVWFLFFSFGSFGREMEGDDPYHDEGRVVGISLRRELERESETHIAIIQNTMLVKRKKRSNSTFQTMHNNIHLPIHQQPLQLLRPNPFRIKFQKRLDLILVGHGTNHLQLVLWSRRNCLQLRDYHFCLGNGKL